MGLHLTEEQKMIRNMVREFARKEILPTAAIRDETGEFPADNIKKMGELGLMGMMIPNEYGGAGLDTVSYSLALQEIAYACASTAVVMSVNNSVVCEPIYLFGSEFQKSNYLKSLARGQYVGSFALTEAQAGSDPVSQQTTATKDGDSFIINGTKTFITNGSHAGVVIVTAYTDKAKRHKGLSAFIVERGTPGFIPGKIENKMGLRASDTAELIFEDCRVPVRNLLGQEGEGFKIAMIGLDGGRIGIASQSVGLAQACLEAAISYAKERVQFGKPIAEFQGIR